MPHLARRLLRVQTYGLAGRLSDRTDLMGGPDLGGCPDEDVLLALARGKLVGRELERVEGHLSHCADCRTVLAEGARKLSATDFGELACDETSPAAIARYRVQALLGAGASGVVYRGFDPQLKRPVALKLLRPGPHQGDDGPSERLLREAQAMARLSDPHVVAVYDVGLHQGLVYLVMEYVDGPTLRSWLGQAPRSRPEILRVFTEAGRGLLAAHEKGLVHRDFKPENVMVGRDGRARVTDFGLARESDGGGLGEHAGDDQASTELYAPTRGLVGTPAYMAPELFDGERATPASDQFAFCVALFVALFEHHPFKAGEGIDLSELVTRVRGGGFERPPVSDPIGERLLRVLERGLSVAPESRFADLSELLRALQRANRPRRSVAVWAALLVLTLLPAVIWWRSKAADGEPAPSLDGRARLQAAVSPPPLASVAPPAPHPSARAEPSAAPRSTSSAAAPLERRRPPKTSDVRYKDWLKDPF